MESTEKQDFDDVFNLSPYTSILPGEAGGEVFDLIKFLYDLRSLPDYQKQNNGSHIKSFDESEHLGEMIYSTQSIADNFLTVAPILLYRLTESYLKKYLLILNEGNLKISEVIMKANITSIKKLYLDSPAKLSITTLPSFEIIEELRELNNSLKHNHDLVSVELHNKNNYWKTNELINVDNIKERITDFDHGISCFFNNLVDKVKPYFS